MQLDLIWLAVEVEAKRIATALRVIEVLHERHDRVLAGHDREVGDNSAERFAGPHDYLFIRFKGCDSFIFLDKQAFTHTHYEKADSSTMVFVRRSIGLVKSRILLS